MASVTDYDTTIFPYDAVVFIQVTYPDGSQADGSGVLIGPHTVLTASHVLYNFSAGGAATSVAVYPGDSNGANGVPISGTAPLLHTGDILEIGDAVEQATIPNDFAILDFAQNLTTTTFGIETNYTGSTVDITGYPAIPSGTNPTTQYDDSDVTVQADTAFPFTGILSYAAGTTPPGYSGGPLWVNLGTATNPIPYVVGLVSTDQYAVQLTDGDVATIQSWEQQDAAIWDQPGVSIDWNGSSSTQLGGDWNTATNWNPAIVPFSVDDAVIGAGGTYTVTSSQDNEVAQLDITDSSATLAITGGTFTVDGALNNAGTIDVTGGTFIVKGPVTSGTAITENSGTLEFDGPSNIDITFATNPYSYTTISDPLGTSTSIGGINDEGQVVGSYDGGAYGFIYSDGTYTTISDPTGAGTQANAINDNDEIIGGYQTGNIVANGEFHGFLYSDGTYATMNDPSAPAVGQFTTATETLPVAINNNGEVVGFYTLTNGASVDFLYSDGTYTTISDPLAVGPIFNPEFASYIGINDQNQIVGIYDASTGIEGFLYSNGTYTTISDPLGGETIPQGINDSGEIFGRYVTSANAVESFLYSDGTYTTISDPLGIHTIVTGLNDEGQLVGYYEGSNSQYNGFIYSDGTFTTVNDPLGTEGTQVLGINNAGQIFGDYNDAAGQHSFITSPENVLTLADPSDFTGAISGFQPGGIIDLTSESFVAGDKCVWQQNGGTGSLALETSGGTLLDTLTLSGQYSTVDFKLTTDNNGGTLINLLKPLSQDDFYGTGTSDILFRNDASGDTGFYLISNGANVGWNDVGASSTAYSAVSVADFTGNGTDDILYRNNTTGDTGFYAISNGVNTGWQDVGASSTAYSVAGVGDFFGNGTDDILYRNNSTGDTGFYAISNGVNVGWYDVGASSTAYSVVGVGDFLGNGTDDILYRNSSTGDTGFYAISNGVNTGWYDVGASSTAYSVVGVGDFNGDGTSDILYRSNSTGDTGFYAISNGVNTGWYDVGASSTAYSVVATGDYLGNGTSDILFRNNSTGDTGFYAISNGVNIGWHDVGASSSAYHVAS
jgi:probable HAF family extracellular repeat protein